MPPAYCSSRSLSPRATPLARWPCFDDDRGTDLWGDLGSLPSSVEKPLQLGFVESSVVCSQRELQSSERGSSMAISSCDRRSEIVKDGIPMQSVDQQAFIKRGFRPFRPQAQTGAKRTAYIHLDMLRFAKPNECSGQEHHPGRHVHKLRQANQTRGWIWVGTKRVTVD